MICWQSCVTWLSIAVAVIVCLRAAMKMFVHKSCKTFRDLEGSNVIVTGGSVGIGRSTVVELVFKGAKVVFTGRDFNAVKNDTIPAIIAALTAERMVDKPTSTKEDLAAWEQEIRSGTWDQQGNFSSPRLWFRRVDFSDLREVEEFTLWFKSTNMKLNVLINNTGGVFLSHKLTAQKLEWTMGINHFAHYYLTELLFSTLTNESRIINLSSSASKMNSTDISEDTDWEEFLNLPKDKYSVNTSYARSKLANVLFSLGLQHIFDSRGLKMKSVSVHPGVVASNFFNRTHYVVKILETIFTPIKYALLKNNFEGSQTTLHCVHTDFNSLAGGKYHVDCKETPMNKYVTDSLVEKFMRHSQTMIEKAVNKPILSLSSK